MRVVYMQYSYKARICLHVLTLQHFCCTYKYQKYKELSAYNGTKNTRSCLHNQLSFLLLHQQYKELSVHSNLSNASGFLYTHTSTKGTRNCLHTGSRKTRSCLRNKLSLLFQQQQYKELFTHPNVNKPRSHLYIYQY